MQVGGGGGAFAPGETGKIVQQKRALNAMLTGLDFIPKGLEALEWCKIGDQPDLGFYFLENLPWGM